jgi:hypothetical protein
MLVASRYRPEHRTVDSGASSSARCSFPFTGRQSK